MPANESLNDLREQLIRRGMPLDYTERSVAELEDHHADLMEELQRDGVAIEEADEQALARLGEPKKLVKRIVRDYQRRTLTGRWPLISFVLAPLPLLFVAWCASLLLINYSLEWAWKIVDWGRPSTLVQMLGLESLTLLLLAVVPTMLAYVLARTASRTTRNRWYAGGVCLIVSLAAGSIWTEYSVSDQPLGGRYVWASPMFEILRLWINDIPYEDQPIFRFGPRETLQLLAPLAVGVWLIYRETKRRREALGFSSPLEDQRLAA